VSWSIVLRVLAIVAVVWAAVSTESCIKDLSFAETEITELTPLQEKQLDLFMEMNRLLTTLATLVIGALGAILAHRYSSRQIPAGRLIWAGLAALASGCSLLCGYLSFRTAVWMLHSGFFNLFVSQVELPTRAQFFAFLGSVSALTILLLEEACDGETPADIGS
jgi:hypothetical protein